MTSTHSHQQPQGMSRRGVLGAVATGLVAPTALGGQAYGAPPSCPPEEGAGERVRQHLRVLDAVAARHGGDRAAGRPGFEYSARYVERRLHAAGLRTRRQPFGYVRTDFVRDTVEQIRPQRRDVPHFPAQGLAASPDGGHTGELVVPRDPFGDAADSWEGIDARAKVALLQLRPNTLRGARQERRTGCHTGDGPPVHQRIADDQTAMARRALVHARAAGVSAVLFYLDQFDFLIGLFFDAPGDTGLPPAAVVHSSAATALRQDMDAGGATVRVDLELQERQVDTFNVLTVPPDITAPRHLFGAHLDGVPAGPGIDDNASGSALLLDLALSPTARAGRPAQFCWWGGEEDGMRGSRHFVATEPLEPVRGYFNTDMVAAPNYVISVYGDGPQRHYTDHLDAIGRPWLEGPVDGMSDQVPFLDAGIPVAGIDTVNSAPARLKDDHEAAVFGGVAGQPFDPQYHAPGDTLTNISTAALGICTTASHAALRATTR
ncbi:M28 family peptidase [Streptomyces antibioticus]|uniref:M28 family peptidase n=1 Tax=Streptomyces antibioticus TaxID=1890 RepID=UPI0033D8F53A